MAESSTFWTGTAAPRFENSRMCRASFGVVPMGPEHSRRGELPELVPDHGLGDEQRDVLPSVMNGDGVTDHLGDDRGAPGPRPDDALGAAPVHVVDLLQQVVVDERSLLHRSR